MLSNVRILLAMAAYFALATAVYGVWSHMEYGAMEPIGTAAMGLTMILSIFIAYYLYSGHRRTAMLPEDNLEGNIADDSGEVGFFSPWSWWPLILGGSVGLAFLALAVGWWLFYISVPFVLVGVIGFVYEYSRGQHAH
jgi:hypothetical protein